MDPPTAGPPQASPRQSFGTILLITMIIFLLSGGDDPGSYRRAEEALERQQLRISNYTAWLNHTTTNFTLEVPPPPLFPLVDAVRPPLPEPDPLQSSYYHNLTGFLNSKSLVTYNLTDPASLPSTLDWLSAAGPYASTINRTAAIAAASTGDANWTSISKLFGNLVENKASNETLPSASFFHGTLSLSSNVTSTSLQYELEGVHFENQGAFYALVEPAGDRPDIRQLSAIVPKDLSNATAYAIESELNRRMERFRFLLKTSPSSLSTGSDTRFEDDDTRAVCSFIFRGQLTPSTGVPARFMDEYEREMDNPTGISIVKPPVPNISGVLISHNCGLLLTVDSTSVLRTDSFWRKTTTYAVSASVAYLFLLLLLVRQMESTRSPAAIQKISLWTFGIQLLFDTFGVLIHLTVGFTSDNRSSIPLIVAGVLAGILMVAFETRYMVFIHLIQAPENATPPTPPAPQTNNPDGDAPAQTTDDVNSATPTNPPTPNTGSASSELSSSVRSLFAGFTLNPFAMRATTRVVFFVVLVILIQSFTDIDTVSFNIFMIYSFWVPQIVRNAQRGTRAQLSKKYLLGTSICRLYFALYIFACPNNVMFIEPSNTAWLLVGWMGLQTGVLIGQQHFGPTFFLPKRYRPPKGYDYHVSIPLPDEEAPEGAHAHSLGDCSVCLEPILPPPSTASSPRTSLDEDEKSRMLHSASSRVEAALHAKDRTYCLAPCHHAFHPECLERWLGVKDICPICRSHLPPL